MSVDLSTPMERINFASHIWENYSFSAGYHYVFLFCSQRGISKQEIEDGAALGEARREAYHMLRRVHGDPAYGGGREWNTREVIDRKIMERAADPGVSYCRPAPGVREMWLKAAAILRRYAAPLSYYLDDRAVSATDLMRDYPTNESINAALALLEPGQYALIPNGSGISKLRAEVATRAERLAA